MCILRAVAGWDVRLASKGNDKTAMHTIKKLERIGRFVICLAAATKLIDGEDYV